MTLGDRVRRLREERGWSQAELARRVSARLPKQITQVAIHHVENRGNVMPRFVVELAQVLEVRLDWLRYGRGPMRDTRSETPSAGALSSATDMQSSLVDARVNLPHRAELSKDLPVKGTAAGGLGGDFTMTGETVDHVRRPPRLVGRKDDFALFVQGDSMEPRYRPGELIVVDAHKPPQNGDHVVVALTQQDGDGHPALLKRLVGTTPTKYRLEQYNPAKVIEIDRRRVDRIYRVMTTSDLFEV